jgi:hypothetical protein
MKKLFLIVAWIWIAVPLGWGVYQGNRTFKWLEKLTKSS